MTVIQTRCSSLCAMVPLVAQVSTRSVYTSHCTEWCFLPNASCWQKKCFWGCWEEKQLNSLLAWLTVKFSFLGKQIFLARWNPPLCQGNISFCWAGTQGWMTCLVNIKRGFLKCCLLSCGTEFISLNLRWVCGIEDVRGNDTWLEPHKVRKSARDSNLI